MSLTERLVTRLASIGSRPTSRRSFLAAATLGGTALATNPWGYLTRPQSAYASVCGPGASCGAGWSAMCCSINGGHNTCPPDTYAGGWWKADRSSFCGGAARYYIDCNAKPGHHFGCHCNNSNCDHRYVACNVFRYGQCNTHVRGVTAVVCRQISCLPPWQLYPGACGKSSATDNNTEAHSAPCLTRANTFPALVRFPAAGHDVLGGHSLYGGHRLTSADRHTTLYMHHNGNVTIRNQNGIVWATDTGGGARDGKLRMQTNGQLVVVDAHGRVRWSTRPTTTTKPVKVRLRDNGQLAVYHGADIVWHTHTHTP